MAENMERDVIEMLKEEYPEVTGTALNYETPMELLVATILSAQTTDVQVNKVTPALFEKYPSVEAYAEADLEELQEDVGSVNFYRNKAKYIKKSARRIVEEYDGMVPDRMEDLVELHGVSRKTANVVLSDAYDVHEGVVVDTHVMRLAQRLGLTEHDKREKIEQDLMERYPREQWYEVSNMLIAHGRRICHARNPECERCVLRDRCPYYAELQEQEA
ncbi:MAG: endonuclease III [Thermoplasmatota archaeon]